MSEEPAPATALEEPIKWYRWPTHQLRRIYAWTLSWAESRYAVPALALLAFVEASFFPIPPDVLLMAMCLALPKRSWLYGAVCSAGSVAGAVLGWYIGVTFWGSLGVSETCPEYEGGAWLFQYVPGFTCEKFALVQGFYQENAWLALLTAAFTVIPFKIFTIAAGVCDIDLGTLVGASAVGRSARFFLVAGLIWKFGPAIRGFLEKRFELVVLVATVALVGLIALVKLYH